MGKIIIQKTEDHHYEYIIEKLNGWWGNREMRNMLPRLFFKHFQNTSFIAEDGEKIVGFLVGFISQSEEDTAYIHFAGMDFDYRGKGVGSRLYSDFFDACKKDGITKVKCVTSPMNKGSIAFHIKLGFESELKGDEGDPIPVKDYDGPGEDRICFVKKI